MGGDPPRRYLPPATAPLAALGMLVVVAGVALACAGMLAINAAEWARRKRGRGPAR